MIIFCNKSVKNCVIKNNFATKKGCKNHTAKLSTTATLGTPQKAALFRGSCNSEVSPIKLALIWDAWGSDWSLLTGGCYLEVVVNTGLTVLCFRANNLTYFSEEKMIGYLTIQVLTVLCMLFLVNYHSNEFAETEAL